MGSFVQEIRRIQPHGPYRLCGFSFGGSEAFQLALRLEEAGEQVMLILLDAYRPSKSMVIQSWLPRIVSMIRAGALMSIAKRKLRSLFTHDVHGWLTGKDKDLRDALFKHAMKCKYRPFGGNALLVKSNGFEEWAFQPRLDGVNGWKKLITGPLDVIHIDAGHAALIKEPAVKTLAGHLNAMLCD
jgi:thioesterase domain-containing protein